MAKFTASVPLNIKWNGNEISGAAGATHRIPDALYDEFNSTYSGAIPGLTWVTQDETSSIPALPIGQTDVTGLTASLAAKYDKTGGTISGAVTATGALIAQTSISTPSLTTGSATISGSLTVSTSGKITNNGFVNPFDSDLWIATNTRSNPANLSQALYAQLRVFGNMASQVMDGAAFEIRLNSISNSTYLNALETSVVITGGANTIPDARSITANFVFENAPTGTITNAKVIVAQAVPATSAVAIANAYGLVADVQTAGTSTNFSIYAPTGTSRLGVVQSDGDVTVGVLGTGTRTLAVNVATGQNGTLAWQTAGSNRWIVRKDSTAEGGANAGSDLLFIARDDTGANIGTVLTLVRSTRGVKFDSGPIGFYAATPAAKQTVTGSRGANAALASLLTALATYGLITDSSS